ncbi:MAG: 23S rRNA (adenine(2030)-N(6))-methyltransferase RlmJ, partial [Mesorhizobium sp.]
GEWQGGISRLFDAALDAPAAALLAPYLEAVHSLNPEGGVKKYLGSPLIARHLMRKQDRLSAIELHRQDAAKLRALFQGDFQTRVIELDGWLALRAHLPPKEKRGLVLVDPPFEEECEFDRLVDGLRKAHKRWPGGIYALWYPVKNRKAVAAFRKALVQSGVPKLLDIGFEIRPPSAEPSLDGCGMVVVNPPFTLEGELRTLLPALHTLLVVEKPAHWTLEWLAA